MILGVTPAATTSGVRSAFRRLAQRYHPDRAGPQATKRFQEITEAYEVLSDPGRRAAYDRSRSPAPVRRGPVEPLAEEPYVPPVWSARRHGRAADPLQEILEHFMREPWPTMRTPAAPADLEVRIPLAQALRGADLNLEAALPYPCSNCGGSGRIAVFGCPPCGGAGIIRRRLPLQVRIPPGVGDGTRLHLPLPGGCMRGHLTLTVRVVGV